MRARPEPWENPDPEWFHFEAVVESDDWRVAFDGQLCRYQGGSRPHCPHEAVAELNRRRRRRGGTRNDIVDSWWAYCAEHMYGRWVEDGQVMSWRLVPNDE